MGFALHPLGIPKCQYSIAVTIFIRQRSEMFGISSPRKSYANPRMERKIACILKSLLFSWSIQLVIKDAWFLRRFKAHCHRLFIEAGAHTTDLAVTICTWIIGLRFLFLSGIINHSLVPCYVEYSIRTQEWNRFRNGGVHTENMLKL